MRCLFVLLAARQARKLAHGDARRIWSRLFLARRRTVARVAFTTGNRLCHPRGWLTGGRPRSEEETKRDREGRGDPRQTSRREGGKTKLERHHRSRLRPKPRRGKGARRTWFRQPGRRPPVARVCRPDRLPARSA